TGVNLVNHSLLYRNNSSANGNHYLQVELEGVKANRDGFGAKVRVVAGGRSFIQEVDGGGASHASQHMSILHFGLGNYTMADTVEVIWPGGNRQYLTNVPADQRISIVEDVTGLCGRKVKNPHAVMVTAHSARLAWEPEHYAIAYRIRGRKVGATSWKYFTLHGGNKHYFDISNLQEGTAYEWQVRAFCDTSGTNHTGWSVKDTFVTGCNYPAMLFTSNITHQSAVLNWSPVYGNKGYIVKGREAGSQQWQRYWVEPNRNFLHIDGLQPGKSYEWAVKTRCDMDGAFSSPYSPVANFTTPANTNKLAANPPKTGICRVPLVFPNPASNELFVSLPPGIDDGRVSIFNSSGSLIYQKILPPSEGGLWLDVSNWHEGMYILRLTHGKQTGFNKFIIAR
ncbi:MAG: T9SS C-terminal target domain-containing protein, partial [Chloroflexi bacterium]